MNTSLEFNHSGIDDHRFIQSTDKPMLGMVTEVTKLISNHYLQQNRSIKSWRNEKQTWKVNYEFPPGNKRISKPINYLIISEHVRKHGLFNPDELELPRLECMWLDHASEFKTNFHKHDKTGTFGLGSGDLQTHYYGENYPIHPILKREGRLFTSFQPQLINRIVRNRTKLIDESNQAFGDNWIFEFRSLISDAISLLEIAFTQFYIKAEYDPLPGWKFDKERLGERHGRRLNDKVKWIFQVTGNRLNIESEQNSLDSLRQLRNHLMHFDPPSLVITLEETVVWLNQVIDIGKILVKLRQAINVDISPELYSFLLQSEAKFVPVFQDKRAPLDPNKLESYLSSIWPTE